MLALRRRDFHLDDAIPHVVVRTANGRRRPRRGKSANRVVPLSDPSFVDEMRRLFVNMREEYETDADTVERHVRRQARRDPPQEGVTVSCCIRCEHDSLVHRVIDACDRYPLIHTECLVCSYTSAYLEFICPECLTPADMTEGDGVFWCESCESEETVWALLNEHRGGSRGKHLSPHPAGCHDCGLEDTVCRYGEG